MLLFWFLNHQLEGKMTYMLPLINTQLTAKFADDFLVLEQTTCASMFNLMTRASQFNMFVRIVHVCDSLINCKLKTHMYHWILIFFFVVDAQSQLHDLNC